MVHQSSRFYRCLCLVIIAGMLFQTGCASRATMYTRNPSDPKPPELESGRWHLEVELRDKSLIKITPLNYKFGKALYVETQQVRGELVSWDEETIRLKRVRVPFRATKFADVFYDIPVAEARQIIFKKPELGLKIPRVVFYGIAVVAVVVISKPIVMSCQNGGWYCWGMD